MGWISIPSPLLQRLPAGAVSVSSGSQASGLVDCPTDHWEITSTRVPTVSQFKDAVGAIVDEGIALLFRGPASFTGEDVAELRGRSGIVVTQLLLAICLDRGARLARPGIF